MVVRFVRRIREDMRSLLARGEEQRMSAKTATGKTRARPLGYTSIVLMVGMTCGWWLAGDSVFQNPTVMFATIIFVAFGLVVFGVIVTAVRCALQAYKKADGRWAFHIGWSVLSLLLLGFATLVVWVLSGTGPVGLDQLPWLNLPPNIIGLGWKYGAPYLFLILFALIPSSRASSAPTSETKTVSNAASHGEGGGLGTLGGMMSGE